MTTPAEEQRIILESQSRVRIVRAVPGSGKTWLVAELIQRELVKWNKPCAGIAALSFTRVGGDEIRKAVGYELDHPHCVGTIDAFLFRYVVRPFLRDCFPWFGEPRLIPGDWGAKHWGKYGADWDAIARNGLNLFSCVFIGEAQGDVIMAYDNPDKPRALKRLDAGSLKLVIEGKKQLWKNSGCLTHSDAAYWASRILEHRTFGSVVRAELVRRFPLLIVDELQDTGYFLGKSIYSILSEPLVHGVLVGDPDQAIFEFTGATPQLFNGFEQIEGASVFPLAKSQRCSASIAGVAEHLKDSQGKIGAAENQDGKALLISYNDMRTDIFEIAKTIENIKNHTRLRVIKIVARSNDTVEELVGRSSNYPPKLGCRALNHIQRAVIAFRQGRHVAALAAARSAVNVAVFNYEGVTDNKLHENNIDSNDWKVVSVRCLLRTNALTTTGNIFEWQVAAGKVLDAELSAFDVRANLSFEVGKLKPKRLDGCTNPAEDFVPQIGASGPNLTGVPVQTVHSVKGETHDVTIFVCPKARADRCPSALWWSDTDREEKRIAYVAMTRSRGDLILCVTEAAFKRLSANQPQFTASFECHSVDSYIATVGK